MSTDISHMFSVTSYTSTRTGSENPPDELQISEEEFTQIKAEIIPSGLLLRAQWQSAANPSLIYWETQVQVPRTKGTQQAERRERRRRTRRLGSGRLLRGVRPKSCPLKGPKTTKNKIQADSIWRHLWYRKEFHLCLYWGQPSQEQPLGCTSTHPKLGQRGESDPQEKVGTEDAHDEEETVGGEVGAVDAPCGRSAEMRGLWWAGLFRPVYTAAALQVCRASEATGLAKVPALSQRVSSPE